MKEYNLKGAVTSLWWFPLVTGPIGIGLGIWVLAAPVASITTFAIAFAICIAIAGVLNTILAFCTMGFPNWGWTLAYGLLELICAIWLFSLPHATLATAFIIIVGIWILVSAINGIAESAMLSRYNGFWTVLMVLLLLATIFFAILFLTNPVFGGVAVWLYLGISILAFGLYRIIIAFVLKRATRYLA